MSTFVKNQDVRTIALGINVSRAAAVAPTVAQSPQNLFTISGGRILVVSLIGEVTTIFSATAYTLKITGAPTAGTAVDWSAVSASLANLEVGGKLSLPAAAATALVSGNAGGVIAKQAAWVAAIGTITATGSATQTGALKWDLTYVPLDVGAQVVAA